MTGTNPNWAFYVEVVSRALDDLEAVCTAEPGSPEFNFMRSEAKDVLSEAREALLALRAFLSAADTLPTDSKTQH
ncbi:MAG: hypothetical protein AAGL90_06490 [Pseudomonadota bacterium]